MGRIELKEISKDFRSGSRQVRALRGVSLTIEAGESVAVTGVSGAGKSTVLQILGCMDRASSGVYLYDGKDVGAMSDRERASLRRHTFGFIPQDYDLIANDTVEENVSLPMVLAGKSGKAIRCRAAELIEAVGLFAMRKSKVKLLSGGERQRVAVARALANDPAVILADEPTSALDGETAVEVMTYIKKLCGENKTLVLVTHDSRVAAYAERQVVLKDGVLQ